MNLTPPLDPSTLEQTFTLFRLSRLIFAAASLDIAGHLAGGTKSAAELAQATGTHAPTLRSLMDALSGWGAFARERDGRYALTPFSRRLVRGSENAASVDLLLGWAGLPAAYDAFGGIMHTLRTGECALRGTHAGGFYDYLAAHPESARLYESAMESTNAAFVANARAYDFSRARLVVDVGGGQGAFGLELVSRYPALEVISYDLPDVVATAQVEQHAGASRLRLVAGNAFESVPAGADVYTTNTVLRCFSDEKCLTLLRRIRAAMSPTARLVAFEMVMPEDRDQLAMCMADMVARTVYGGADRTAREFAEVLQAAGLRIESIQPADLPKYAIIAVPV